nr:MAG TPA: transmembrane G protein-coupled receptor [Caudoviricetes sp.]
MNLDFFNPILYMWSQIQESSCICFYQHLL